MSCVLAGSRHCKYFWIFRKCDCVLPAGEGSSDKPSCQQLSSSSQSSPSRQALPEAPEEAEQEEQAKQVEPLVQEQAEQPEEAKPKATQSDVAPHMAPVADHVEGASSQADPSTQIPQCGLASPPVANEPNSAAAFLPNVRDAHAAEQTVPDADARLGQHHTIHP